MLTEADKRALRHWRDTRPHGDDIARFVTELLAECAELKRLNLALADKLAIASAHLTRVAEKEATQ